MERWLGITETYRFFLPVALSCWAGDAEISYPVIWHSWGVFSGISFFFFLSFSCYEFCSKIILLKSEEKSRCLFEGSSLCVWTTFFLILQLQPRLNSKYILLYLCHVYKRVCIFGCVICSYIWKRTLQQILEKLCTRVGLCVGFPHTSNYDEPFKRAEVFSVQKLGTILKWLSETKQRPHKAHVSL